MLIEIKSRCRNCEKNLFFCFQLEIFLFFSFLLLSFTGNDAFVVPPRSFAHVDVGGRERAKFFRKPLVPFMEAIQPLVVLDTSRSPANTFGEGTFRGQQTRTMGQNRPSAVAPTQQPATRTQAIQTDYMEREAQTDPYTPEYVVKPGEQPEVLTLATLMYRK